MVNNYISSHICVGPSGNSKINEEKRPEVLEGDVLPHTSSGPEVLQGDVLPHASSWPEVLQGDVLPLSLIHI